MASDPDNGLRSEVARRVRLVARLVGLPERDLAQATGVGRATLGRIMRGERDPSWEELVQIADGTGAPRSFLTKGELGQPVVDWVLQTMGGAERAEVVAANPLERITELLEANSEKLDQIYAALGRPGAAEALEDLGRKGRQSARTEPGKAKRDRTPAPPSKAEPRRRGKR